MLKAIAAIVILWLVFALGIGVAVAIGRGQPIPAQITALHLTDCQSPCWIGIVPGKTTIDEARHLLQKTYGSVHEFPALNNWGCSCLIFEAEDQGQMIDVGINRDQGPEPPTSIIEDIDLSELTNAEQGTFTLADAYYLFGKPDAISVKYAPFQAYPVFHYTEHKMQVESGIIHDAKASADLAEPASIQFVSDPSHVIRIDIHWRGFASYDLSDLMLP